MHHIYLYVYTRYIYTFSHAFKLRRTHKFHVINIPLTRDETDATITTDPLLSFLLAIGDLILTPCGKGTARDGERTL